MQNCVICNKDITEKRQGTKTCSPKCRVTLNRLLSVNRGSDTLNTGVSEPIVTDAERREKESRALLARMNEKLAAKGILPIIMAQDLPPIEFLASGIEEIDVLTKGYPRKRITEMFGLKGVGKTTLMGRIINNLPNLKVFYVDAENALSNVPENIHVLNDYVIESVQENVEQALSEDYDLIVVDSVAALVPRAELEGDGWQMGVKARLMNQWMRRVNYYLHKSNAALVFINQQRENIGMYGPPKFTPGGQGLGYAASLRLELKSNKTDKKEKYQLVTAIVEKSRFDRPYKSVEFKLFYE